MAVIIMSTSSRPDKPRRLLDGRDLPEPAALLDGVGETVWIDVIRKMDEVYNDLLQYEVALEEKNAALEQSHQFIESVLASMSDILIVCDRHGNIEEVNASLQRFTGRLEKDLGDASRRPLRRRCVSGAGGRAVLAAPTRRDARRRAVDRNG
jgi:two-component system sensor histidine kinase HupT/HoxJ